MRNLTAAEKGLLFCYGILAEHYDIVRTFNYNGQEFSAYHQAAAYCRQRGWSCGPMQSGAPIAVFDGEAIVSKWRNLSFQEIEQLHGFFFSTGYRNGNVTLFLRKKDLNNEKR